MTAIFHRPELAQALSQRLINPGLLDFGLRSGLFISGQRRIGKSTFLMQDLIPAFESAGALVVYVDLWSDTSADPATLVHAALRTALQQLQKPPAGLRERLNALKSLEVGVPGFTFGFEVADIGTATGPTIAQAVTEVIDQAKTHLVFIVDEVQHMIGSEAGLALMQAFKAARDAVNTRPNTPGSFIFIGTGSHRAQVMSMTVQGKNAFEGATSMDYPVLGDDFVQHVLRTLQLEGVRVLPSPAVASQAFKLLGGRPEELLRALRTLQRYQPQQADQNLPVIAATLKSAAADLEIKKIEELGELACAVFNHIAKADQDASGLFAATALASYSATINRDVTADQVQRIAQLLQDFNIIMRKGYGLYAVTDPFVQQAWRAQSATLAPAPAPAAWLPPRP